MTLQIESIFISESINSALSWMHLFFIFFILIYIVIFTSILIRSSSFLHYILLWKGMIPFSNQGHCTRLGIFCALFILTWCLIIIFFPMIFIKEHYELICGLAFNVEVLRTTILPCSIRINQIDIWDLSLINDHRVLLSLPTNTSFLPLCHESLPIYIACLH